MSSGSLIFFLMYMYVLKKIGEPGDEANNKKVGIVSIGKPCHLLCFVAEFLCQPSWVSRDEHAEIASAHLYKVNHTIIIPQYTIMSPRYFNYS